MTSLTGRAEAILALAKKLDSYHEQNNLPYPSFDDDHLDKMPAELQEQRRSLANASNDLKKLMRGPVRHTMDIATSVSFPDSLGEPQRQVAKIANFWNMFLHAVDGFTTPAHHLSL